MHVSNLVLYGTIEAFVLLCVLIGILFIYIGKLKKKQRQLTSNANRLVSEVKKLKEDFAKARQQFSVGNSYKKQINDQLLVTREYHKTLNAGQDIALDLNPSSPFPRQAAALRHAILIAEKEALHTSEDGTPNWKILETKFNQVIQFYADFNKKAAKQQAETVTEEPSPTTAESDTRNQEVEELQRTLEGMLKELGDRHEEVDQLETELETAKKRITNLEHFKKLFFEMEDQWRTAKKEAQTYYEHLTSMRDEVKDQKSFDTALNNYHNVYAEVEKTILSITGGEGEEEPEFFLADLPPVTVEKPKDVKSGNSGTEIHNSEKRALEELNKLRNITADQHRLISQLQKKLEHAKTAEEKTEIVKQLQKALEQQVKFVKESELCVQLLEDELSNAMKRSLELEQQLLKSKDEMSHIPKMQETIHSFAMESKTMLECIAALEQGNAGLTPPNELTQSKVDEQASQLALLRDQLQSLQSQYADLEERYLEARNNP